MAGEQESRNPATGALLGSVPLTGPDEVPGLVAAAGAVQPLWAQLRVEDRARYMRRAAQALIDEAEEVVELVCREQGRPRAEARLMELLPAVDTLLWLADAGPDVLGPERVALTRSLFPVKRARVLSEPLGVVGVISPAAEPLAVPLGDVAVALMAGNGVVLKPSPLACLTGERIGRVFARAGVPEGLLRIAHGGSAVGRALVDAPVAQIRLTGSPEAGRQASESCARAMKPCTIGLAGKDPMLVLDDAPMHRAVRGAVWGAFANAGQSAGSIERAYVPRRVHEGFVRAVVARASALRPGDPLDPGTEMGPITSAARAERMGALLDEAIHAGAVLHCGGRRGERLFAPAVLTDVPAEAALSHEEAPGPVLEIVAVDDVDEAIALANRGPYGLGASVWSADRHHAARVAGLLRCGMVWVNDHLVSAAAPQLPWGGIQGSGIGRARGVIALRECSRAKVLTYDPPVARPPWWHPYDRTLDVAARALTLMRSARDRDRSRAWREGALPLARLLGRSIRR